jgi:hypothetical protein
VSKAILGQAVDAIEQGRFEDGERLLNDFNARPRPHVALYMPGDAEHWSCLSRFYQGTLTGHDLREGYDIAVKHRNHFSVPVSGTEK